MKFYSNVFFLILFCQLGCKETEKKEGIYIPSSLITAKVIKSKQYDVKEAEQEIVARIKLGIYNDYEVDLCIDDLKRCNIEEFTKYKKDSSYTLTLSPGEWNSASDLIKKEILNEIIYYTWGHEEKKYNALDVSFTNNESPFDFINVKSKEMYKVFSKPRYLKGGKGKYAYGPNCWYTSISSIVDKDCKYSRLFNLKSSTWDNPRFMGAAEFRCYMSKFEKVSSPQFGDIVRYYTDSAYYDESIDLYNGEVHAAIYIGVDSTISKEIVLTKNGRNDLNFLLFQDVKGLDELYLGTNDKDPRIKNYFRLKAGTTFFDAAICGSCSDCYKAYKIDSTNYQQRWECLVGRIQSDTCNGKLSCYCFPKKWQ